MMDFLLLTHFILCVSSTQYFKISAYETVEVATKVGNIMGKITNVKVDGATHKVHEFLGIPYAEAPVGNLRFRKPMKRGHFRDTFNATEFGAICPQGGIEIVPLERFTISEDCLLLNVFVPSRHTPNEKFAVMIYIHGGLFITGASNFYVGDVLSGCGDVIVVTVNYRLSIFGFLSTGDEHSKGNYGLWDQQLAIQWVHDNIASFNGNPEKVTIFGQSAGAVSAILQALHPGNKGLFQRVIAESGTPITFGAQNLSSGVEVTRYQTIGHMTGCPYISSVDVLQCLREKRTDDIMRSVKGMFQQTDFEPVVDGDFILGDPNYLLDSSSFNGSARLFGSLDVLIGGNSMEGASYLQFMWKALLLVHDLNTFAITDRQFKETVVPKVLQQIYGKEIPKHAVDAATIRYTDITEPRNPVRVREMLLKMSTDYGYRVPNLRTALLHHRLGASNTYMYEFKAKTSLKIGRFATPVWVTEANHGDESAFVFGFSSRMLASLNVSTSYHPSEAELELSQKMITAWTNFARYGKPNSPDESYFPWPVFTEHEAAYLEFALNDSALVSPRLGYGEPGGSFWLSFMPHTMATESRLNRETLVCDEIRRKEEVATFGENVSGVILILLSVCTGMLLLSLAVTCFCLRKKKEPAAKYDAVEV